MTIFEVLSRLVHRATDAVERAELLDAPSDALDSVVSRVPPGPVRDVLSGVPLGHPVHPALVAIPIGAFTGALTLDLTGREQSAARTLVGLGLLASVPAALTGLSDWSDTRGAERRVGLTHLALNSVGLGIIASSWLSRGRDPGRGVFDAHGPWLTLTGFGLVGLSSWLGGHLAYALGVGVDTTAFLRPPTQWTDAIGDDQLVDGQPVAVTVDGMPVLLVRLGSRVYALGDRCTHRGAPLHEGVVEGGCIECPWHGSRFALEDGAVVRGPATAPAAALETRVVDGRVQVRRSEERTLRLNPAG